MKRLLFTLLFTCFVTMIFAQDLKTAKSYLDKQQLDKAKTEIDAFVAKSPSDPEGNYMKAKIYEKIAGQCCIQKSCHRLMHDRKLLRHLKKQWQIREMLK